MLSRNGFFFGINFNFSNDSVFSAKNLTPGIAPPPAEDVLLLLDGTNFLLLDGTNFLLL